MLIDISDPWAIIALLAIFGSWIANGGLLDCADWLRAKFRRRH